jgi:phosphoribosylglycinamide formyltransferase-1
VHYRPVPGRAARLVVLVSGGGSNLAALLEACADPSYGAQIVAVGADRSGIRGLGVAAGAHVPTFVVDPADHDDRASWDAELARQIGAGRPDLVVSAGFMRLFGPAVLDAFGGRIVNTHPALLPSFPGAHAVRDALAYGVRVTGATLHVVDSGVDTGPIVAQVAVPVEEGDDEHILHERIKVAERRQLVNYVGRLAREGWGIEGRRVTIP